MVTKRCLIAIRQPSHTRHDTENVVIGSIDTNLSSLGALNGGVRENKLKGSIVNAGEVARSAWLMLLWSQGKGVHIDTGVRSASVVLVRLDKIEVSTLTLREAILAVKLELSGDNRVLTPAVKSERSLSEDESSGIRYSGFKYIGTGTIRTSALVKIRLTVIPPVSTSDIGCTGVIKETRSIDKGASGISNRIRSTKRMDSVGKGINRIGIVKRLSTKNPVEKLVALKRRTVVDVLVRLYNPNEFLNRVVKVEFDLVGRRTDRLIASELKLLNKVLMGILSHTSTLIGIQEDIVNVQRCGNQRLIVSSVDTATLTSFTRRARKRTDSPQALINRTNIEVNLDFVILKSDERKSKTGVTAVPELEGNIKSSFWESVTRSAYLTRSIGLARTIDSIE
jgi:hypothetical protein